MVTRIALAVALLAAAPVETQLSSDGARSPTVAPGWVSWIRQQPPNDQFHEEWVLWHGGSLVPSVQVSRRTLGTDAKGRPVAIDFPCSGCRAVERRLSDSSVRPLPRRVVHAADENRGTLAYVRRGLGIFVLRRGARHAVRVSKVDAATVALGRRWLVYWDLSRPHDQSTLAAIDLSRAKPRERMLAFEDFTMEECRCSDSYATEESPTIDGRFAYWVETVFTGLQGVAPPGAETRILRVDLDAKRPWVERFSPAHFADALAVDRGTIYYTLPVSSSSPGVFRVSGAEWTKTGRRLPEQG
jgi:hypothetical protein